MIMENVSDLSTLSSLTEAYPSLLTPVLESRFVTIIEQRMAEKLPEELRQYVYTILLAERKSLVNNSDFRTFLTDQMEGFEPRVFPVGLPRKFETLKKLANLNATIDFFAPFCAEMFLSHLPLDKRTPLSCGEDFRIRRALLRLQLFVQIFHQPEATDELSSDRDWEQRFEMQKYFWTRLDRIEIEECKCIYVLLTYLLRHLSPFSPSVDCNDRSSEASNKSRQRGLPLLQSVFLGLNLTPLEESYAQRFLDYAFTGFEKIDPLDGNFCVPHGDFRNLDRKRSGRRYLPSEEHREQNFGVNIYWRCERRERRANKRKDAVFLSRRQRMAWRLIGYCFWDKERTDLAGGQFIW